MKSYPSALRIGFHGSAVLTPMAHASTLNLQRPFCPGWFKALHRLHLVHSTAGGVTASWGVPWQAMHTAACTWVSVLVLDKASDGLQRLCLFRLQREKQPHNLQPVCPSRVHAALQQSCHLWWELLAEAC